MGWNGLRLCRKSVGLVGTIFGKSFTRTVRFLESFEMSDKIIISAIHGAGNSIKMMGHFSDTPLQITACTFRHFHRLPSFDLELIYVVLRCLRREPQIFFIR